MILNKNDKVAIISPASQFRSADRELLPRAIELLQSWSLQVIDCTDSNHHFYLAGDDDQRQHRLNSALTNVDIKAIFCSRGGYGSQRLLAKMPRSADITEKMLIGHSDITALHMAALALGRTVSCIHGPNIATHQLLDDSQEAEDNRNSLKDCLFQEKEAHQRLEFIRGGDATGRIVGGCMSMIIGAIGTPYLPELKDSILFLEDVGEAPYKIDRMLTHLKNSGALNQIKGLVFGAMHRCEDPYNDLREVIGDVLHDCNVPIAIGLESGHGPVNNSIRLRSKANINSKKKCITINNI